MTRSDVLIVGGGPAGSTCAWKLVRSGFDVSILDKAAFPRDKVCAGWITPQVVESLQLDLTTYAQGRVLQPIDGFHVSLFEQPGIEVGFGRVVSYAIRRCEFDDYLLRRSKARLHLDTVVRTIEKTSRGWCINGEFEARMLIGAGGHFCPVAKLMRSSLPPRSKLITAVETEFPISNTDERLKESVGKPYLCFREDLSGYGWCFRKQNYYNIGVGLVDSRETNSDYSRFGEILRRDQVYTEEIPTRFRGHAYYLYDGCRSRLVDDGVMLIGDAAGLAYPQSGEGIRPAVESGVIAAQVIQQAAPDYVRARLESYRERLMVRLGRPPSVSAAHLFRWLGKGVQGTIVRRLLRSPRFVRNSVIFQGFLHGNESAITS